LEKKYFTNFEKILINFQKKSFLNRIFYTSKTLIKINKPHKNKIIKNLLYDTICILFIPKETRNISGLTEQELKTLIIYREQSNPLDYN